MKKQYLSSSTKMAHYQEDPLLYLGFELRLFGFELRLRKVSFTTRS
jgi:hypothetical protein